MKRFFITLLLFFISISSFSQNGWEKILLRNNTTPPELSSLSVNISYDEVDLSTGRISPSIPFFSIGTNDLKDEIKLNYISGSGIRVNDYASDIGLGWDLNAGGYIVREVKGIPDEARIWPNGAPSYYPSGNPMLPPVINGQAALNGWLDHANWGGDIVTTGLYGFTIAIPINPIGNKTVGYEINNFSNNFKNGIIGHIRTRPSFMASLSQDLSDITASGAFLPLSLDGQPDIFYFKCPDGHSGKFIFDENGVPTPIPYNPNIIISSPIGPNANNNGKWIITVENGTQFHYPHNENYYEKTRTETSNYPYTDDWYYTTPDRNEGINVSEYVSKWYIQKAESTIGNTLLYSYVSELNFESVTAVSVQQDFHVPTRFEGGAKTPPPNPTAFSYGGSSSTRTTSRDIKEIISYKKRLNQISCSNGSKIVLNYNGINREDVINQKNALGSITLIDLHNTEVEKYTFNQDHFYSPVSITQHYKRPCLTSIGKQSSTGEIHSNFYRFNYYLTTPLPNGGYQGLNVPKPNSTRQDFWGYSNNNTANTLIPALNWNAGSASRRDVPGGDRSPNEEMAKAYMLKEIIFPTGGTIEYNYELNDFKNTYGSVTYGYDKVPTGGLRIKSIKQKEINNQPIIKSFTYTLPNFPDVSSGQIPIHLRRWTGNGAGRLFEQNLRYYWYGAPYSANYITRYSYLKYLQASDLIRYSHVTVDLNGNGKIEYQLTAFDDYSDTEKTRVTWSVPSITTPIGANPDNNLFYASNNFFSYEESTRIPGNRSPRPTNSLTDKSYLRGLILNIKEYIEGSVIPVKETINTYELNPNGFNVRKIYSLDSNADFDFFGESQDWYEFGLNNLNFDISSHDMDLVFLKETKTRELASSNQFIENTIQYTYNNEFKIIKDEKLIGSDNSEIVIKKYYPFDTQVSTLPYMSNLVSQNRRSETILEETYKGNVLIFKKQIGYNGYNLTNRSNAILPHSISTSKGNNPLDTETEIILRDGKANVREISKKDGTKVVYLWGYNQTLPIAKIENATYASITPSLITSAQTKSDTGTEASLLTALTAIRKALPDAMVTTYTHKPLIGVSTITDPKGDKLTYEYDEMNRLKQVKDKDGNILSENEYNYKN